MLISKANFICFFNLLFIEVYVLKCKLFIEFLSNTGSLAEFMFILENATNSNRVREMLIIKPVYTSKLLPSKHWILPIKLPDGDDANNRMTSFNHFSDMKNQPL